MFTTFNSANFTSADASDNSGRLSSNLPRGRVKALRARSRTGCSRCKRRKKKCDEVHPECGSCKSKNEECIWIMKEYQPNSIKRKSSRTDREDRKKEGRLSLQGQRFQNSLSDANTVETLLSDVSSKSQRSRRTGLSPNVRSLDSVSLDSSNSILDEFVNFDFSSSPSLLSSPSSNFSLYLDGEGIRLLELFERKVARILCISSESSNYFLKTFFTVSINEESVSNDLAAWGAVFSEEPESGSVRYYMNKSMSSIKSTYLNKRNLDKYDYFVSLCYLMISIGVYVCSGDTRHWYNLFSKCTNLLQNYGGFVKFVKDFNYSNDVKWLLSNFQFHDIMSSVTLVNGTICLMNSYNDLFKINKLLDTGDYGVDPYQGCIQPIYLLLGEIMNRNVELKRERVLIDEKLQNLNADESNINVLRLQHYRKVDEIYSELLSKVEYCKPNETQFSQLTEEESDLHLILFELYCLICKMYLLLYIKQIQPKSNEVQNLLLNSLLLIDTLIESRLVSSLNMSLLTCGISCCSKFDRFKMNEIFKKIYSVYGVGNVKRIWEIVSTSWIRNPDGNICIDWVEICDKYGWKSSVC